MGIAPGQPTQRFRQQKSRNKNTVKWRPPSSSACIAYTDMAQVKKSLWCLKLRDMSIKRQSTVMGSLPQAVMFGCSPIQERSLQPLPLLLLGHTKSHLSLLVQEGSLSIDKIDVSWARHNVWYLQSPSLLFLHVGGEKHWVAMFSGTQDGATLRNAAAQGKRVCQLLRWRFGKSIRFKAKVIESTDLQMACTSLQLLLQKFFRDQREGWLTKCQAI